MSSTTSERIRSKTRRTITTTNDLTYTIRALPLWKFIGVLRGIPDLCAVMDARASAKEDKKGLGTAIATLLSNDANAEQFFTSLLTHALVDPQVGKGPGEIDVADIPWEDQGVLAKEVLELCGFNRRVADALRPTSSAEADTSSSASTRSEDVTDSDPRPS